MDAATLPAVDGGSPAPRDSSLVWLGDGGSWSIDAAREDVWPLSDAVRVIVRALDHSAVEGSTVWFHDASGALLQRTTTDAEGTATSGRPGIAAITVQMPAVQLPLGELTSVDYPTGLYSVWDVAAGDTVVLELPVSRRPVSALGFGVADHLIVTAAARTETTNPLLDVWDSTDHPALFAYASSPSASGEVEYALAIGGSSSERLYLRTLEHTLDTVPVQIANAPPSTRLVGWAALGSDVGMLWMTFPALPAASIDHVSFARGFVPGPEAYLGATATDDRGTSRRDYEVIVPYDHAADAAGFALDLAAITPIDRLTLDPTTLEVGWGTTVDADVVELSIGYTAPTGGLVQWTVVAPGGRDRLGPPHAPELDPMPIGDTPAVRYSEIGVTFERRPAFHDYAAFRTHPLGPFDPAGWAGTRIFVWDQPR